MMNLVESILCGVCCFCVLVEAVHSDSPRVYAALVMVAIGLYVAGVHFGARFFGGLQ